MERLRDDDRIRFAFVGGGKRMDELERFAERKHLPNFLRLPYFPREQLSDALAMGDAHLVTLRDEMAGVAVPCKTYGIMAAGRPVLYVGPEDSDTARHIRSGGAGIVFGSRDGSALAATIAELAEDRARADSLGSAARAHFIAAHEKHVGCAAWDALLAGLHRDGDAAHSPPLGGVGERLASAARASGDLAQ
jgi:glycosyltransferase involved in cell wall biosynthesis